MKHHFDVSRTVEVTLHLQFDSASQVSRLLNGLRHMYNMLPDDAVDREVVALMKDLAEVYRFMTESPSVARSELRASEVQEYIAESATYDFEGWEDPYQFKWPSSGLRPPIENVADEDDVADHGPSDAEDPLGEQRTDDDD